MEEISNSSNTSNNNKLPPGFRFHPTDEELITYYLCNKISDFNFTTKAVAEVDLNKCEPWDLPAKATMGEKEWYFFSQRDRKYPTGLRTNRATEAGYWKTTGKDKEIFHGGGTGGGQLVGMKKTLVFYRGRAPKGEKTNWVMHEYRLIENNNKLLYKPTKQEEWVVCRVFQKTSSPKRPQQSPSSPPSQGSPSDANAMISELGDIELPNFGAIHPSSSNYSPSGDLHANIMNWPAAAAANTNIPSMAAWPLLTTNLQMNSLLLTALQLRGHQQQQARSGTSANPADMMINTYNTSTFMPPAGTGTIDGSQFGDDPFASGFNVGSTSNSVPHMPQQEQPYDINPNLW